MPVAIVMPENGIMPAIIHETDAQDLLNRLGQLKPPIPHGSREEAAAHLATMAEPSGWFESIKHANAYLDRIERSADMSGDEIRSAREEMEMTRADFAESLGIGGNSNTRHKEVFEIENGRKRLNPQRTRALRAMITRHGITAVTDQDQKAG